jgi:hypothetical protein
MKLEQKEITLHYGNRPLWQIIIGAFFYTLMFYFIFYFFYSVYYLGINDSNVRGIASFLQLSIFSFIAGLTFTLQKSIYINLEKQKLKTQYSVGIIKINYHSKIPELEYVSVFKNPKNEYVEINLWYDKNKHFNICNYEFIDEALEFGIIFSNKLKLDLLDATEKGNFKWIDKTES